MWITAIHGIHFFRGITGIAILNGMPMINEIIDTVPLEDRVMRMAEISRIFADHVKSKGLQYMDENRGKLTFYGILTIICLLADLGVIGYTGWQLVNIVLVFFEFW